MATNIKLMVDTKTKKVVFAEASNDFVDLLFYLLSLPIATVIKLLTSESMVGSFGNLYTSFSNLNEIHLLPNIVKHVHLNPLIMTSATNIPMLVAPSSVAQLKLNICKNPDCKVGASNTYCSHCGNRPEMWQEVISIVKGCDVFSDVTTPSNDLKGYVKEGTPYMIYDDLNVKPMSITLINSIMNKVGIPLKEMEVKVEAKEMLEMLKASFQSTTVLSDVFLGLTVKNEIS